MNGAKRKDCLHADGIQRSLLIFLNLSALLFFFSFSSGRGEDEGGGLFFPTVYQKGRKEGAREPKKKRTIIKVGFLFIKYCFIHWCLFFWPFYSQPARLPPSFLPVLCFFKTHDVTVPLLYSSLLNLCIGSSGVPLITKGSPSSTTTPSPPLSRPSLPPSLPTQPLIRSASLQRCHSASPRSPCDSLSTVSCILSRSLRE